MDITMIPVSAWQELERRFPAAYHLLLRGALKEEKRLLEAELDGIRRGNLYYPGRKEWIEDRLATLNQLRFD